MRMYEDPPAEISHPAHPAHKLKLVTTAGVPFVCDGCKEPGDGPRYTCHCGRHSFDLHTCCALAEAKLAHPLFRGREFVFLHQPPPPVDGTVCDACGDPARGFVYHCYERDLDLHPCCASLQARDVALHGHTFQLHTEAPRRCSKCGGKGRLRRFWAYRSCYDGRSVDLHLACMKRMARRSWEDAYKRRVGGGGGIVQACEPIVEGVLKSLPDKTRSKSGFDHFYKIVSTVVNIVIAVIFGNPMAMIAAVAGPGGTASL